MKKYQEKRLILKKKTEETVKIVKMARKMIKYGKGEEKSRMKKREEKKLQKADEETVRF